MPPKKLVDLLIFALDIAERVHRKAKSQMSESSTTGTVEDCFPSTSSAASPFSRLPVRVPRKPLAHKGARTTRPMLTEDIVPAKKRVTLNLSDTSSFPPPPLSVTNDFLLSIISSPQCSTSDTLPFVQSLSLLLTDLSPSPPTSSGT